MLDWQIENPLEEYHLEERERAREVEELRAEAELDRIIEMGGIENGLLEYMAAKKESDKRPEERRETIPRSSEAAERSYSGFLNAMPGGCSDFGGGTGTSLDKELCAHRR